MSSLSPLLSILTPSIPRRIDKLRELLQALEAQTDPDLEVLVLLDNCTRPLGHKRNELMRIARGQFVCHIDDDEMVAPDFVARVLSVLRTAGEDVDVVAYDARVTIDQNPPFRVRTALGAEVEQVSVRSDGQEGYNDISRPPWHWCTWRRELAVQFAFPDFYYGEDWHWLAQILPAVRRCEKIDEELFHHRFSTTDSSASHEGSGS